MTKNRCRYSVTGFIFSILAGTVLHFAFEFTGGNTIVGAFTPVNESVWEHLKLLLFPIMIFSVFQFFAGGRQIKNFVSGRIYALLIGMALTVMLFYTYTGLYGNNCFYADISIFIVSVAAVFWISCVFYKHPDFFKSENSTIVACCIITAVIILFIYFTFNPPMFELFRDPLSEDFGIIQ